MTTDARRSARYNKGGDPSTYNTSPELRTKLSNQELGLRAPPNDAITTPTSSVTEPNRSRVDTTTPPLPQRDGENVLDSGAEASDDMDCETERVSDDTRSRIRRRFPYIRKSRETSETKGKKKKQKKKRRETKKVERQLKGHKIYTVAGQIRAIVLSSWVNVLLPTAPTGIALHYASQNTVCLQASKPRMISVIADILKPSQAYSLAAFIVNLIALVPLTNTLEQGLLETGLRTGDSIDGILAAIFGNTTSIMVATFALFRVQSNVVTSFLTGSLLFDLLLTTGASFFFGGMDRVEQHFNITAVQTTSSFLLLGASIMFIPSAFARHSGSVDLATLKLSHATSIILLVLYGASLIFRLKTHACIYYTAPSAKPAKRRDVTVESETSIKDLAQMMTVTSPTEGGRTMAEEPEDEGYTPDLSIWTAILTFCVSGALIGICSMCLLDNTAIVMDTYSVPSSFIGFIVFPMTTHVNDLVTAVTLAYRDKMDLAICLALGDAEAVVLFITPLLVIIGWIAGVGNVSTESMALDFDGLQAIAVIVSAFLINFLIQDGKSHWLLGFYCIAGYTILGVAAWINVAD